MKRGREEGRGVERRVRGEDREKREIKTLTTMHTACPDPSARSSAECWAWSQKVHRDCHIVVAVNTVISAVWLPSVARSPKLATQSAVFAADDAGADDADDAANTQNSFVPQACC